MGYLGGKYPIQVEKFENGVFRSKILHIGRKSRKWGPFNKDFTFTANLEQYKRSCNILLLSKGES